MAQDTRQGFKVRLPRDLDEWIEREAKANCRTKTGEIEFRLRQARQLAEAKDRPASTGGEPAAGEASRA